MSLLSEKYFFRSRQNAVLEKMYTQKFKAKVDIQEDKNLKKSLDALSSLSLLSVKLCGFISCSSQDLAYL